MRSVTLELSRCTLTMNMPWWSGGSGSLRSSQEATDFSDREEKALLSHLKKISPALEVILDEYEARGLKMQRKPIAGVASIKLGDGSITRRDTVSIEYSCEPREVGPLAYQLFERLQGELAPRAQGEQRVDDDRLLDAIGRFEEQAKREPDHLRLRRWLELVSNALGGQRYVHFKRAGGTYEAQPCGVCGAAALAIEEGWTDSDWHATQHDALHSICLSEPHVVTLFEN